MPVSVSWKGWNMETVVYNKQIWISIPLKYSELTFHITKSWKKKKILAWPWYNHNIQPALQLWILPNLKLEGKILIFKTLVLSKITFQIFKSSISKSHYNWPNHIMSELEKKQKDFGEILFQNLKRIPFVMIK